MALVKTLSNVKRMKRAARLREEGVSDEEITEVMEEIIQNALVAQASGSPKAMKRAVDEMKQVRKSVIAGQIKTRNQRQKNMVGRFSQLVDQLEGEEQETIESGSGGGGLASSMPSMETLVSSIMVANPILGYSTKIVKDLGSSVVSKSKRDKELAKKQAQTIEQQKEYILDRMDALDQEQDLTEKQEGQLDTYKEILERIEGELVRLRQIWDDDATPINMESEQTTETNNKLSKLVEAEERVIENQRLQQEQDEFDRVEARRVKESGGSSGLDSYNEPDSGEGGGILAGLAGMLGGGLMSGIMGFFGLIKGIAGVGTTILKLGIKGSLIGSVIMAVYDFIEGFFNAGDILDMAEEDLNIGDRLIAGISNVVAGFGKLLDTILEWFDIDIIDSENLEQRISQGVKETVDKIFDWLFGLFDSAKEVIANFDVGETLEMIKQQTLGFMNNLLDVIPNAVSEAFGAVTDFFTETDWWGSDSDEALTEEGKEGTKGLKNPAMGMSSDSPSKQMTSTVNNAQNQSITTGNGNAGVGIVTGNGNTNISTHKTEVITSGNTSNPDDSFRQKANQIQQYGR